MGDKVFTVEIEVMGREVYEIVADDAEDARRIAAEDLAGFDPVVTEVTSVEGIVSVREVSQ